MTYQCCQQRSQTSSISGSSMSAKTVRKMMPCCSYFYVIICFPEISLSEKYFMGRLNESRKTLMCDVQMGSNVLVVSSRSKSKCLSPIVFSWLLLTPVRLKKWICQQSMVLYWYQVKFTSKIFWSETPQHASVPTCYVTTLHDSKPLMW